jgi:hypothetical protein
LYGTQLKNGGYETTREIEARNLRSAQKKAREIENGCCYGSMSLREIWEVREA